MNSTVSMSSAEQQLLISDMLIVALSTYNFVSQKRTLRPAPQKIFIFSFFHEKKISISSFILSHTPSSHT